MIYIILDVIKKITHDYHKSDHFALGYKWYVYKNYDFITINYKYLNKINKNDIIIKVSSYYDVSAFKRLESRIMENTSYKKIKSKQNRIILC